MTAAPQTAPSAAPRASSSAASMNLRRYAPYIIVGVAVVGYVIYRRRSNSTTPAAAGQTVVPTAAADAQTSPSAEDIAGALADLQGQNSTTPVTDVTSPWKPPTGEKLVGSGYTSPPNSLLVTDSSGDVFQGIVSNISAGELKKAGETLYYQVLPGIFEPAKGTLRTGTSLFYKQKRPVSQ